ncbi:MAG: hypothetical protein ABJA62_00680 [Luteimonas sp.]
MKSFNSVLSVSGLVVAVAASLSLGDAHAATSFRELSGNATSYCQTALPIFDGQVRKRPLAVQNEGTSNAFITCSFTRHFNAVAATAITMYSQNNSAAAKDLTCTLVTGHAGGPTQFVAKTVTLPADGTQKFMRWLAADFTGGTFPDEQYSMTCNLLPGVGLNDSYLSFDEDVGA